MRITKVTLDGAVELFQTLASAAEDASLSRWTFSRRLKKLGKVKRNGNVYSKPINR